MKTNKTPPKYWNNHLATTQNIIATILDTT